MRSSSCRHAFCCPCLHCFVQACHAATPHVQLAGVAGNTYLGFAAVAVVALVTIYLTVPETRGKTLEEIETMFASDGKGE